MSVSSPQKAGSAKARAQAARLAAVQALYELSQNRRDLKSLATDYESANQTVEGDALVPPDAELLKRILSGVVDRFSDIDAIVRANLNAKGDAGKEPEPLLRSILLAGTYEIMAHQDIDFPIIINDYVNVAHSFYSPGEARLVNAVLDAIQPQFRSVQS